MVDAGSQSDKAMAPVVFPIRKVELIIKEVVSQWPRPEALVFTLLESFPVAVSLALSTLGPLEPR